MNPDDTPTETFEKTRKQDSETVSIRAECREQYIFMAVNLGTWFTSGEQHYHDVSLCLVCPQYWKCLELGEVL